MFRRLCVDGKQKLVMMKYSPLRFVDCFIYATLFTFFAIFGGCKRTNSGFGGLGLNDTRVSHNQVNCCMAFNLAAFV